MTSPLDNPARLPAYVIYGAWRGAVRAVVVEVENDEE